MRLRGLFIGFGLCGLSACATVLPPVEDTTQGPYYPYPDVENPGLVIVAEPLKVPPAAPEIPAPRAPTPEPPIELIVETPLWYNNLPGWATADHRPAFTAFRRSCESWKKAKPDAPLNPNLPEYGQYRDWLPACALLPDSDVSQLDAKQFFEAEFAPLAFSTQTTDEGVLTGYYEPEISVRLWPDKTYSEPILAKPNSDQTLKLPRSAVNARSSRVIAYGKPIDVFFMQIQGSGRLRYRDGRILRAAYAANNGQRYKSIGRVLVERGEMPLEKASKQAIEKWMKKNGPQKTRELMNENPRYIYFKEQAIGLNEGPRGAMEVPLTDMGSIAVDPRYHPYGTLAWLETKLPQKGGDFRGQESALLVSIQDTGSAIKGPLRGDLFFGAGKEAGDKAGVMKHAVRWTILVPRAIAPRGTPIS